MPFMFEPPTTTLPRLYEVEPDPYQRVNTPSRRLFSHVRRGPVGQTVLKHHDGTYTTTTYPTTDDLKAAAAFYEGGHTHWVSAQEAASLRAAGYVVTEIAEAPTPPPVVVAPSPAPVRSASYDEARTRYGTWLVAMDQYKTWETL